MKLKDVFSDSHTKVFVVSNQDDEDELNWTIEPTEFDLLPEDENIYYVKAYQVSVNKTSDCFIGIVTPERIAESVVKRMPSGQVVVESVYDQKQSIIPAVASECSGVYELFYAKENPQIGIDVLKEGIIKAINKNVVAEDLGYILRDEEQFEEAVEAFKISAQAGPSSVYVFLELSRLYQKMGQNTLQQEYYNKFKTLIEAHG